MNSRNAVFLILAIIAGLIAVGGYYLSLYIPDHNWTVTYNRYSDEPYGTEYFVDLLEENGYEQEFLKYNDSTGYQIEDPSQAIVLSVSRSIYADSARGAHLKNLVDSGACLFLATEAVNRNVLQPYISDTLKRKLTRDYPDTTVELFLDAGRSEPYSFHHQVLKKKSEYDWSYFRKGFVNDTLKTGDWNILGKINDKYVNFVMIESGKGRFYQHLTPIAFTNYHLARDEGYYYVRDILQDLPQREIYWIDPHFKYNADNSPNFGNRTRSSPLEVMLSNTSLRWAWYTLLAGLILFLLFNLKRRQRAIKVINPPVNSSVYYAQTVGQLFYQNGDARLMAIQLMDLFHAFVIKRYKIQRTKDEEQYKNDIIRASELEADFVNQLFERSFKIRYNELSNNKDLVELHKNLELFYKTCR